MMARDRLQSILLGVIIGTVIILILAIAISSCQITETLCK
jgi:hypothetical protein